MIVYVVEHGVYSDTRVVAVTDSEDTAKAAADAHRDGSYFPIELNTNGDLLARGYRRWDVYFKDNSTEVMSVQEAYDGGTDFTVDDEDSVIARDEAEAAKIASERRARWLVDHDHGVR